MIVIAYRAKPVFPLLLQQPNRNQQALQQLLFPCWPVVNFRAKKENNIKWNQQFIDYCCQQV